MSAPFLLEQSEVKPSMFARIKTRLKWWIAGDEMAEVERWRVRCSEYDRWLASYPDISLVLQNLRAMASGEPTSMSGSLDVPWPTAELGPWDINALRVLVARFRKATLGSAC